MPDIYHDCSFDFSRDDVRVISANPVAAAKFVHDRFYQGGVEVYFNEGVNDPPSILMTDSIDSELLGKLELEEWNTVAAFFFFPEEDGRKRVWITVFFEGEEIHGVSRHDVEKTLSAEDWAKLTRGDKA
ncbi:MAG: hypothetical protein CMJ75_18880 [Planctomycetaceae bacterium]|nr:hypothetical protein [Planctomycetaceae bacterium]